MEDISVDRMRIFAAIKLAPLPPLSLVAAFSGHTGGRSFRFQLAAWSMGTHSLRRRRQLLPFFGEEHR